MIDLEKCIICNAKTVQKDFLWICTSCKHGYREFENNLIDYHKNEYRKNFTRVRNEFDENGNVTQIFHDARKKIVEERLMIVKKYLNKNCTIVDIGSGAGTFAYTIKPFVKNIICLELDDALVKESNRLGFKTIQEDFITTNFTKTFDIVFAWHVLEHIENIHEFIKKCYKLSNEYVIIEVPTRRAAKQKFDGHVHYFNENSLSRLAHLHGFKIEKIQNGVQKPAILIILKKII